MTLSVSVLFHPFILFCLSLGIVFVCVSVCVSEKRKNKVTCQYPHGDVEFIVGIFVSDQKPQTFGSYYQCKQNFMKKNKS